MNKEAKTDFEIHDLLKKRWSPRAFADKPVEKDRLQRMFEAARWSPSASNEQPWYFILGQKGDETYDKIYECLVEFNQLWTKFAPVLMLSIGKENNTYQYDVGQAVAHLSFQATADGLYVHQMAGFSKSKAKEIFELPEYDHALTAIAAGYIGDPEMLHPRMQKSERAERERKEMKSFVFSGKFGNISKLV
ncbi:MAG: nitroreductase family protein [Bacteroidota bacterium]|nr:nitroreductase family protein [Bacteroidota bacterium]